MLPERLRPKYELGDKVVFKDKPYYVSGIRARIAYGSDVDWLYNLTGGLYGDHSPSWWSSKVDFETYENILENKILTPEEYEKKRRKELQDEIDRLDKMLEKMRKELD